MSEYFKLAFELRVDADRAVEDLLGLIVGIDEELLRVRGFHAFVFGPGLRQVDLKGERMVPFLPLDGTVMSWGKLLPGEELEAEGIYTRLREGHPFMSFATYRAGVEALLREQLALPEHSDREVLKDWYFGMQMCGEVFVQAPGSEKEIFILREVGRREPELDLTPVLEVDLRFPCQRAGCVRMEVSSSAYVWSYLSAVRDEVMEQHLSKGALRNMDTDRNAELLTEAIRAVIVKSGLALVSWGVEGSAQKEELMGGLPGALAKALEPLVSEA